MNATIDELKKALIKNYNFILFKSVLSLSISLILISATIINFNQSSNKDKVVNSLSFISSIGLIISVAISSNNIIIIGGKIKMLLELDKDVFIEEVLLNHQKTLTAVNDRLIALSDYQEIEEIATQQHSNTATQNAIMLNTQEIEETATQQQLTIDALLCPSCNSQEIKLNGMTRNKKQRYKCNDCNKTFS
jgi:predicted RNA-binding Zn-ribbon protein involved in translation (DUF1610 family)